MIGCTYSGNPRTGCNSVPKATSTAKKVVKPTSTKSVDTNIYLWKYWGKGKTKRKRYCRKSGNDIKCDTATKKGSTRKFVMRALGNNQVALKVRSKWCADEGDKVKCNRSAIGGWEKFTLKQNGGGFKLKGGKDGKWCRRVSNKIRCDRGSESSAHTFYSTKR
jgi:hypothetical protein